MASNRPVCFSPHRVDRPLLTGPSGVGKSWLACALGHKACRENLSLLYQRVPRLSAALALTDLQAIDPPRGFGLD